MSLDRVAEGYLRVVLGVGGIDPNYVDAYYGPEAWRLEVEAAKPDHTALIGDAAEALHVLRGIDAETLSPIERQRAALLNKQLEATIVRVKALRDGFPSFDEESAGLYDLVAPHNPDAHYAAAMRDLAGALPGDGPVAERFDALQKQFLIPPDRLEAVFGAAINAARARTKGRVEMPADETFRTEYVRGEVWGAYNWYQGHSQSVIQVNTDFPIPIDRAVGLACHEGYPGHHVYNMLLEQRLVRDRGWMEFSAYPLYSPQSVIAEGTAEYGVDLCFPPDERLEFEQDVLYPLAGLDPARAAEFSEIRRLADRLAPAANDAARRYLDGDRTREETIDWLVEFSLASPERAAQRTRFFDAHRSYTVTYDLGKTLVKDYIESRATTPGDRWSLFTTLLSTPQVPSALR